MEKKLGQIIESAPEEKRVELEALLNTDEIIENLVPIYDKYYTVEDLQGLIRFHQSPLGQKVMEVPPQVLKETLEVNLNYFKNKTSAQ